MSNLKFALIVFACVVVADIAFAVLLDQLPCDGFGGDIRQFLRLACEAR